jgi:hypothetical protein
MDMPFGAWPARRHNDLVFVALAPLLSTHVEFPKGL